MKEKWNRLWRKLNVKLPVLSRRGKIIRNFVVVCLLIFCCWILMDAPAFSREQEYYRAARRNMMGDMEILAIVDTSQWPDWSNGEMLVVAEGDGYYAVCTNGYEQAESWEKTGDVMMLDMPLDSTIMIIDNHPFLLVTELPAHRAEIVLTLPPEMDFGSAGFEGAVLHGEAEGENGVFLFHLPDGIQARQLNASHQRQQLGHALDIFGAALRGLARDYGCSPTVEVRLWDARGQLIYDDTLTYEIKG